MATPGKPSKKELRKQTPAKTSFTSPFTSKWKLLPQDDVQFILQTVKDKLSSTGLEKKEVKVFRPWRKKNEQKLSTTTEPVPQPSRQEPDAAGNGWTDVVARRQLAIGINEVTKALERNQLRLLLVCKSVKPNHMTNHLIALSASRGVPACQLPRLSQSVSELLGLKSVLALGFKQSGSTDKEVFEDTVEAIRHRVPSVKVSWLQGEASRDTPECSGAAEARGQKRKLESGSEEPPSCCTLQPLKVKKIVANPAKKRKVKPKKRNVE
ncbi:ribonuclease P protein subunit p38 [Stegastes partitus]|uniref:Ribonuclease P protein subunit p38 n=1 Tax=Stegastes partitus TaxID=144197 RepID=A0A3B5BIU3_9TELE|nr:PREDICTED: ribonuclease P protein subunit p38 [Stegastes partitus]